MTDEKAIEVIKAECYVFNPLDLDRTVMINQALDRAVDALKRNGRTKGKWITKAGIHGVAYCSRCDYELHINDCKYCPNCGAKMEVGNEDIENRGQKHN